uniref:Uncharacterized protein n=1 Tax=viral metagenome TaxID=1070528 RepID=A0A6H1ZVC9_9ZZZZ
MACKDLPDHTRKVIIEYTGGFIGLEELATRLGFIAPFNLQGNVVLMEDFETEMTEWLYETEGGPGAPVRSSRHKWSGNWSADLAVNAVINSYTEITRHIHFPGLVKYGLFGRFCWKDDCRFVALTIDLDDNTNIHSIRVGYSLPTNQVAVFDDTPGWQNLLPLLDLANTEWAWYPFLVTFDLATLRYDKLYIAGHEYDLSTYGIARFPTAGFERTIIGATGQEVLAIGFTFYVEDIVLVKNLP